MSAKHLLGIKPDVLFQEHSVSEIDDTQKKLLHEIERKREELRVMVGERYRDLIEAADTIGDMRSTAQNCIKHIENMTLTCRKLHDTHLIGFKTEDVSQSVKPTVSRQIHSIAIQIKILMAIPEQIWSNIDVEDYLTATQLYLFAQHIYTGLQLETGGQSGNKNIAVLMPVVHRQWNSLSNFNQLLIDSCQNKLGSADLTAEVAASCLTSLYLLNSEKKMIILLNLFIVLHSTNTLSNILTPDIETNLKKGNVKDDIKERITTSVKVIVRTVQLLHSCFVDNEGLIIQNLNTLFKKNSQPLINLVQFHDTLGLKLLPPVVAEFRLTPPEVIRPISSADMSNIVGAWIRWVKKFSAERVESLLKYVKSAKSLHTIREDATKIDMPQNWIDIYKSLSVGQQNANIWSSLFQPLLTQRVKDIISVKWDDISTSLKENIDKLLERANKHGSREKESNLNWFVWNDLIDQSSIDSGTDIIKSINTLMKGMTMQDRGFTPNLENLCDNFNRNLDTLLEDINIYLYGSLVKSSNAAQLDLQFEDDVKSLLLEKSDCSELSQDSRHSDRAEIENYLRMCSKDKINSIIEYIHKVCMAQKDSEMQRKTSAILTARFLVAMPQLVPSLRACFIPPQIYTAGSVFEDVHTADVSAANTWADVCKTLNLNCHQCWEKYIEITLKNVDQLLVEMPQEFTIVANMDYLLVQWDSITIEEKDDQDQPVISTIKIPSGPSMKLQQFLYSTSRILDEVIPHTLPKRIHQLFIESVADKTLQYFDRVITDKSEQINQKCALQLLMDVRHLTLLLISRDNKKGLADSHKICDLLRQKIDPFDYDVFYPRLQNNAKRSVQRVQTLLGSLVPNHDQLNSIIGLKPLLSGGTADKEPNSYIITGQGNSAVPWFPLLPVTTPLSVRKSVEKQRKKTVQNKNGGSSSTETTMSPASSSASSNTSNIVRSGAAAFFGSMTSDWFGG